MEESKENNIVAFVGKDHLLGVTKQMVNFLNRGEDFVNYKRPPQVIDNTTLLKDDNLRKEYIKRHALNSIIYDEGGEAQVYPPFIHKKED